MWKAYRHWKGEVEVFDPVTATMAALSLVGGGISAAGTVVGGQAAKTSADFAAKQLDQRAQESRASAQRSSLEKDRETGLALSRLQANAAASGGGADDPTVLNLAGDISARGKYQALMETFGGENRARGQEDEAAAARFTGKAKEDASYLSAAGTLIGSAGSAFRIYNSKYDKEKIAL